MPFDPNHDPVCDVLIRFKDRTGKETEVVLQDSPFSINVRQNSGAETTIIMDANAVAFVHKVSVQHLRYVTYIRNERAMRDEVEKQKQLEPTEEEKGILH